MHQPERTHAGRKTAPGFEWGTLKTLARYLWPRDSAEIRLRVSVALCLLAFAKDGDPLSAERLTNEV